MISVIRVYEAVRDLCNKDQKGFVTPAVFNRFADVAQQNVFNEMFNELKLAQKLRVSGSDAGRDKSAYKMVEEDLSYFIVEAVLNVAEEEGFEAQDDGAGGTVDVYFHESATASKPANLSKIISMSVVDTGAPVEIIYDQEKANRVLNSNLSAPTDAFPVALISGRNIEIFPNDITSDVYLTYYKNPSSVDSTGSVDNSNKPTYSATTITDGFVVANVEGCYNFELPSHYFPEVVGEIARMIGVRLRDDVISQYGNAEINSK
jgi:hypothetical protein